MYIFMQSKMCFVNFLSFLNWFEGNFERFFTCCFIWCFRKQQKLHASLLNNYFSSMNWCNMSIHGTLSRKAVITNAAFEELLPSMNRCNMFFHVTLLKTAVVTNVTFEWLFIFVNWSNMCFQAALFRTAVVTYSIVPIKRTVLLSVLLGKIPKILY